MFIMLNPSTADEMKDDRTISRCIAFAKLWGYGGIMVGNLFAYRATKPEDLLIAGLSINNGKRFDIVGSDNEWYLKLMASECDKIVFAWGTEGYINYQYKVVEKLFDKAYCFGKTKAGFPSHPLYLKSDTELIAYQSSHRNIDF